MGEQPILDVIGDVGSMDDDHRLLIPSRVRDSLEWFPRKGSKPFTLIADLRESGLIRLYPAERARARVDAIRRQLVADHAEPLRALAALADRYRELSYYSSDSRVHCGAAVGWHLRSASLHVMTLERRAARLQELKAALDFPDE